MKGTHNVLISHYRQKKKEPVKVTKEVRILSNICKECGRNRHIPSRFCNECWEEMNETINKRDNNE